MLSFLYNSAKAALLSGSIDWLTDTIKVALVGAAYAADKDAHAFFDDLTAEISGTGYTAGGAVVANISVAQDNVNDRAVLDANDVTWPLATFTVRGAVLYKATGNAATSPLIAFLDFGEDKVLSGEDFSIHWNSEGVLYLGEE
jgi:hypothetical protein